MKDSTRKVMLVGDGAVGSSFAFSLLQHTRLDELIVVDINEDRAKGDVLDLKDILPDMDPTKLHTGSYSDASDCDVVVITAGIPRKPGETRLQLVNKNVKILDSIVTPVVKSGFNGVFVVSSNPVDILTAITQRLSGFPKNRVIGTGTSLDTDRLKVVLAEELAVSTQAVDTMVLGEHGDTSFPNFDEATVNGQRLAALPQMTQEHLADIEQKVRARGGEIINLKGATYYGVARNLARIVQAILEDSNIVLPVSAPMRGEYGLNDMYIGAPAVINASGIAKVIETPLSDEEMQKMQKSAEQLSQVLYSAN
mgnify:CR=1 FL=1